MQKSISIKTAAKIYGKDPSWIRAGIIQGYLPIGVATRNGKQITDISQIGTKFGRINYYISPKLLFEQTGWRETDEHIDKTGTFSKE